MVTKRMGKEPHLEIDPDAAVALGAAVQAGIIAGEEIDSILVDVTPLSLGIATAHVSITGMLETDRFAPLIRRNTTIPVRKSENFQHHVPRPGHNRDQSVPGRKSCSIAEYAAR